MTTHEHAWAVDKFHAGFGCQSCHASYWDWSRIELKRLDAALAEARAEIERLNGGWTAAQAKRQVADFNEVCGYLNRIADTLGCANPQILTVTTALRNDLARTRALLEQLLQWDHLDGSADGPYWRRAVLGVLAAERMTIHPHYEFQPVEGGKPECGTCGFDWPCDAFLARAEIERLREGLVLVTEADCHGCSLYGLIAQAYLDGSRGALDEYSREFTAAATPAADSAKP